MQQESKPKQEHPKPKLEPKDVKQIISDKLATIKKPVNK